MRFCNLVGPIFLLEAKVVRRFLDSAGAKKRPAPISKAETGQ
jgi:hypothetical protein